MLGMSLLSFLILTFIGAVVAATYHYGFRYRFLDGNDAVIGKLIIGWLGAWLGSPVLGHWLWKVDNVYIVVCCVWSLPLNAPRGFTLHEAGHRTIHLCAR